jgi:hypothetical protein
MLDRFQIGGQQSGQARTYPNRRSCFYTLSLHVHLLDLNAEESVSHRFFLFTSTLTLSFASHDISALRPLPNRSPLVWGAGAVKSRASRTSGSNAVPCAVQYLGT